MSTSKIWVLADPHLGHDKVAKARNFDSVLSHDEKLFVNLQATINPRKDSLILLGDIAFGIAKNKAYLETFFAAKTVRCVMGNHDKPSYFPDSWQLLGSYQEGSTILTHLPVHPFCLEPYDRWKRNIHGHFHAVSIIEDYTKEKDNFDRYRCVSLERTDLMPVLLSDVIADMQEPEPPQPQEPQVA